MVQLYNCTRIYIATYRQSIAFRYIYIVGHFSVAREGKKATNRPQKVAQAAVCRRSEHHAVFFGCLRQCCPHYCLGQGTGGTLTQYLEKRAVSLQRVWFVTSRLAIYAALPRTIDRLNAKLGEGVKRLF